MQPHRQQPTRFLCPWDSPGKNTEVVCHFPLQCMKAKSESEVSQSFPTLSDPMDCSLPGSSVHVISQARVLEWGAIAFSNFFLNLDFDKKCGSYIFIELSQSCRSYLIINTTFSSKQLSTITYRTVPLWSRFESSKNSIEYDPNDHTLFLFTLK